MSSGLAQRVVSGDRRALARALTLIEAGQAAELVAQLHRHTGRAHITGMTGSPGSGKSTLVAALAQAWRARDKRVAILAVDPTSPYTGGALLGDRVRMQALHGDSGSFVRSMAVRGGTGGVARACRNAIRAMDAAGYDSIIVETVGAGQADVEIARLAHTVVVVEVPGLGDDIQAIKAGLLEIAHVYVVNKADLPGAERVAAVLAGMLRLGDVPAGWLPPVVQTVATRGDGVAALADAIERHAAYLHEQGRRATLEVEQAAHELLAAARDAVLQQLQARAGAALVQQLAAEVAARRIAPADAAAALLSAAGFATHSPSDPADGTRPAHPESVDFESRRSGKMDESYESYEMNEIDDSDDSGDSSDSDDSR